MCSGNCNNNNVLGNNMNSFTNPNLASGTIGLAIENGNNTVFTSNTTPFNNGEALNSNVNSSNFNNNSYNCNVTDVLATSNFNNNSCNTNDILTANNFNNNNSCNCNSNSCGCNCNGNNSCNCNCSGNNSCGCNCNGCNNNNSCGCNCNGNNTTSTANITNNNDNVTNDCLQRNLRNFIGRRVTLEFNNCGTCSKKTGVLTCVGCNFVTLRSVNNNNCLLADTAGLNFVTVHNCGECR